MFFELSQVISQIIAFLVMLWILKKFGWQPLLDILDERKAKIQSEFNEIDQEKKSVETLKNEYQEKLKNIDQEARHQIQEAIAEGNKISAKLQEEAQENVKATLLKAQNEAKTEMTNAKTQLKRDMINMVIALTEKILQQKLDDEHHQKLIADFVKEAEIK